MGPTIETRSRDEWLAEVKRRGGRLRRRRQITMAVVGALALVLPVTALTAFLGGAPDRDVRQLVAGPGPTIPGDEVPSSGPALEPAPSTGAPTTTVAPDQLQVEGVHGRSEPPVPATISPSDNPVITRPPVTKPAPADPNGSVSSPILAPPPSTTVAPSADPAPAPCPSADVRVTVTTAKPTYSPGETVQGSSTLENSGTVACLLPTRAFFRIVNGAGKDVGSFAYTMEFRYPVRAEPGRTFSSSFTWDQRDCSGPACAQVPAGTYTVVADWSESGPYAGRSTFQIVP